LKRLAEEQERDEKLLGEQVSKQESELQKAIAAREARRANRKQDPQFSAKQDSDSDDDEDIMKHMQMVMVLKVEQQREASLHNQINRMQGEFLKQNVDTELVNQESRQKQSEDLLLRIRERELKRKQREQKNITELSEAEIERLKHEQERDAELLKDELGNQEEHLAFLLQMREKRRKQKRDQGQPEESDEDDKIVAENEEVLLNLRNLLKMEDEEKMSIDHMQNQKKQQHDDLMRQIKERELARKKRLQDDVSKFHDDEL
jgi:hypothetical protein